MTLGIVLLALGVSALSFWLGYLVGFASGLLDAHKDGAA